MSGLDQLVDVIAEAVAKRVVDVLRAEERKKRAVLLTPAEMAARKGVSIKTLANLRSKGEGPKYVKRGGAVRYPVDPTDVAA